ncbi:MAG: LysR substrate-binding domain-containing protein [Capsulimonas sp.]|uniref:LysR substrate-binding domain-containing protein n=1 Tax=Capsulimonas sp. TaxID=2494211 RepID=UPI003265D6CE
MELRHLRYFVAVADELNFRRAAEKLFMEQPPLSRQIRQLEEEVGLPLFERNRRRVTLTLAGQAFLKEARATLSQAEKSIQAARAAGQWKEKKIGVSSCACLCKYSYAFDVAFAQAMRTLRDRDADLRVMLMETPYSDQERMVAEGKADVAFLPAPPVNTSLISHELLREAFVLALPQEHLAAKQPVITLEMLGQENLFLFPEQVFPSLHADILTACGRAGFQPRSVQAKESLAQVMWLVGAGLGVGLVGASCAEAQSPGIVLRPIQNFTPRLELSMAWKDGQDNPILAEFLRLMRGMF